MKRFLAMLLASVLAVGIIAFATNGEGRRTDGLYYEVTGIRPDAQIMTVDGEKVSAEEYLYWLSSQCDKLAAYYPGVDFNTQYTDSMTFGDFVKTDAQEMAKLYAIVRQWSEKYGVTLTDADREEIAQQRAQYVSYYGSEEAYQNQLRLLGISEESFNTINEAAYYYADLAKLFCNEDGAQRPSDETLIAFAADNGYCTAKTLYVRTSGLDEAALAEKRSQLEAAAEQLRAAEDKDAAYLELAASLGIETNGSALTFRASDISDAAAEILSPLQSGEVSDIVEGSDVLYVFLMQEPDCTALAQYYFKQLVSDAQTNAKVKTSRAYDRIDTASFYTGLQEARSALATSLQGDGANAAG